MYIRDFEIDIDLGDLQKAIYKQGYSDGGTDMKNAKQIIIDSLLKQLEEIKESLPTCDRDKDYRCPNSLDDCFECMEEGINKIVEILGL